MTTHDAYCRKLARPRDPKARGFANDGKRVREERCTCSRNEQARRLRKLVEVIVR